MSTTFSMAPEVEEIARPIVAEYHRHLITFEVRIEYVFRDDVPKQGGKQTWATARKVSSLNAFLANSEEHEENAPFFCIVVSNPIWNKLKYDQKIALIDHELCHCGAEEVKVEEGKFEVKLSIIPHDLEEFRSVVARHGYWAPDVKAFAKTVNDHQDSLPFGDSDGGISSITMTHGDNSVKVSKEQFDRDIDAILKR
jgi:predicted metallopeptidase